jgi:hypothetical protein
MYWAAARAQPQREAVAQHFLELKGFTVYLPRLREQRVRNGARSKPARSFSRAIFSSRSSTAGGMRGGARGRLGWS